MFLLLLIFSTGKQSLWFKLDQVGVISDITYWLDVFERSLTAI